MLSSDQTVPVRASQSPFIRLSVRSGRLICGMNFPSSKAFMSLTLEGKYQRGHSNSRAIMSFPLMGKSRKLLATPESLGSSSSPPVSFGWYFLTYLPKLANRNDWTAFGAGKDKAYVHLVSRMSTLHPCCLQSNHQPLQNFPFPQTSTCIVLQLLIDVQCSSRAESSLVLHGWFIDFGWRIPAFQGKSRTCPDWK